MKKNSDHVDFRLLSKLFVLFLSLVVWLWIFVLAPLSHAAPDTLLPDLAVQWITVDPVAPLPGQPVTITITVKNQGDVEATMGGLLRFYDNPTEQPPISTTVHTSQSTYGLKIPAGQSYTYKRTNHVFPNEGRVALYASIDVNGQVVESNEENNVFGPVYVMVGNPPPPADSFEPDNDCGNATTLIPDGIEQAHNFNPIGDVDYFVFSANAGVTYEFEATGDAADLNIGVDIEGSCGLPHTGNFGTKLTFTPDADGQYFLRVYNDVAVQTGVDTGYRVRLTKIDTCKDLFEPDNFCSSSSSISADGVAQLHNFCEAGDEDWTTLSVIGGISYTISLQNIGSAADSELELHEACGILSDVQSDVQTGTKVEFAPTESGIVFIRTTNRDPNVTGPNTEYSLSVTSTDVNVGCAGDSFEPDDSADTAKPINDVQTHNSCPHDDRDWGSFDAIAGTTYVIETFNLAESADTVVCLYDAAGTQIECNDDQAESLSSLIVFDAVSSGKMLVEVRSFNPESTGPATQYDLQVLTMLCRADSFEPDDGTSSAPLLELDSVQQHDFCGSARAPFDVDVAQLNIDNSGRYLIETFDLAPNADTIIEILNDQGNQIASNDDYQAESTASQIVVDLAPGTYFVRVSSNLEQLFGPSTAYSLHAYQQVVPPTSTPTPTPSPVPTIIPTPSGDVYETLILVNQSRMIAQGNSSADVTNLMNKLTELAIHPTIKGQILQVDQDPSVAEAYQDWDSATEMASVDQSNRIAGAIRNLVLQQMAANASLKYLIIIGNDPVIPFFRQPDRTSYSEKRYDSLTADNHTRHALRNGYFFTDDGYGDSNPQIEENGVVYVPDLAIGRLVESPNEVVQFIDHFITNPSTGASQILVTGYDFVGDVGQQICADWKAVEQGVVDCLINTWNLASYRELLVNNYNIRSINIHANHFNEGVPGGAISASQLASMQSGYGIVYSIGCHSGLNNPLGSDLAQVYNTAGYHYIGNSGYGWGAGGRIVLSELMAQYYTEALIKNEANDVGSALVYTKREYFTQHSRLSRYDQKVMQQWILYGLPQFGVETVAHTSFGPEFPSATFNSALSRGSMTEKYADLKVNLDEGSSTGKVVYDLDGHTQSTTFEPVQPRFFVDVTDPNLPPLHGVVLENATYRTLSNFDPLITIPTNEFVTETVPTAPVGGWLPSIPIKTRYEGGKSQFVAVLGQFDPNTNAQRLYDQMGVTLYYNDSSDQAPPEIHSYSAVLSFPIIKLKVGTTDSSGIGRVVVAYTNDDGVWSSVDLTFDETLQKWTGQFNGTKDTLYLVQAVDKAGNVAYVDNKGRYVLPLETVPTAIETNQVGVRSQQNAVVLFVAVVILFSLTFAVRANKQKL